MRLRQLARKLEVSPEKIIALLAESGDTLSNEANGKLTAEQVVIVESYYGQTDELNDPIEAPLAEPEIITEVKEISTPEPDTIITDTFEMEVPLAPPADVTSQISEELVTEEVPEPVVEPTGRLFKAIEDEEEDPNIEVIKAPKIELEGLKVVGKIDLPEPKPKKAEPEKEEIEEENKPRQKDRHRENRNGRGRDRGRKRNGSPNSIEEERKRQERIALRKKRDREAEIKKRKEANYRKRLKQKPVAKKPQKKVAPVEEPRTSAPIIGQTKATPAPQAKAERKSALRRFWGWLNGEYDQY